MASESTFPGRNPFGGARSGGIPEEDEIMSTSPTASSFAEAGQTEQPYGASQTSPFASHAFNPSSASTSTEGFPSNYAMGRRTSVSAEVMTPQTAGDADNWKPPVHNKTQRQLESIRAAVANNFLFSHLAPEQMETILAALAEKPIPARGIKVISQGDVGDNFYIVESGAFDVLIHPSGSEQAGHGSEGMGRRVASIGPGGNFGELALMYNAPRAATVVSTQAPALLWALDRVTFRRILMDAAFNRRRMYESFLDSVPLLKSLTGDERSKVADALETIEFPPGSAIIRQGDIGDRFFLLEEGEAAVFKREEGALGSAGPGTELMRYRKGDYFGELALLDDKPRAASVLSVGHVRVAWLGKDGFRRLLGPVEDRMRRDDPSKRRSVVA